MVLFWAALKYQDTGAVALDTTPHPKRDHTTETRTGTRPQTNRKKALAPTENFG